MPWKINFIFAQYRFFQVLAASLLSLTSLQCSGVYDTHARHFSVRLLYMSTVLQWYNWIVLTFSTSLNFQLKPQFSMAKTFNVNHGLRMHRHDMLLKRIASNLIIVTVKSYLQASTNDSSPSKRLCIR